MENETDWNMEFNSSKSVTILNFDWTTITTYLLTVLLFLLLPSKCILLIKARMINRNIRLFPDYHPPPPQWLRMKDKTSYLDPQEPGWAGFAHLWTQCPDLTEAFFPWGQFLSAFSTLTPHLLPVRQVSTQVVPPQRDLLRLCSLRTNPLLHTSIMFLCFLDS